jgi:hypothetical protein
MLIRGSNRTLKMIAASATGISSGRRHEPWAITEAQIRTTR